MILPQQYSFTFDTLKVRKTQLLHLAKFVKRAHNILNHDIVHKLYLPCEVSQRTPQCTRVMAHNQQKINIRFSLCITARL